MRSPELSGVSPRTIFRHYQSHDVLIAATVKDMFEAGARPIENLPSPADDLDGWLEALAVAAHTRNVEILGNAFWDLHAQNGKMSAILTELGAFRREYRRKAMRSLTALAWRSAGGTGEPPEDLVLAFALNLSAFTTQALMIDFDQTPAQIGVLTAEILKILLRRAVEAQLFRTALWPRCWRGLIQAYRATGSRPAEGCCATMVRDGLGHMPARQVLERPPGR